MSRQFSRHHRRAREKKGSRYRVVVIFLTLIVVIGGLMYVGWAKCSAAQQSFIVRVNTWWTERKARIQKKLASSHEKMNQVASIAKVKPSSPESLHFEFYSMLPNNGVPEVTETAPIFSHELLEQELAKEMKKTAYVIQTGIYSNVASADKIRQWLAEDGLASKVVKAYMDEHLVYRVQVGPYEEKEKINEAQSKLAARGIHGTLRKVGDKIA